MKYVGSRHRMWKYQAPSDVHVMNKNESAMMRKIMAKYKISKDEVLKNPDFLSQLSKSQKDEINKKSNLQKKLDDLMKTATIVTGLVKEHPKTIFLFNVLKREMKERGYYPVPQQKIIRNFRIHVLKNF